MSAACLINNRKGFSAESLEVIVGVNDLDFDNVNLQNKTFSITLLYLPKQYLDDYALTSYYNIAVVKVNFYDLEK